MKRTAPRGLAAERLTRSPAGGPPTECGRPHRAPRPLYTRSLTPSSQTNACTAGICPVPWPLCILSTEVALAASSFCPPNPGQARSPLTAASQGSPPGGLAADLRGEAGLCLRAGSPSLRDVTALPSRGEATDRSWTDALASLFAEESPPFANWLLSLESYC